MTDLKTQHLLTLAHILSKGGKHNFVNITTISLGKEIGKSQQSASLHLKELELGGFIERIQSGRKQSIKITNKGFIELSTLHSLLSKVISKSPNSLSITGTITSGMGEGAYYMSMKGYTKQFKSKINNKIDCELILLERTHHDTTIVEFIAKNNIRKSLKIGTKSNVKIKIAVLGNFS